MSDELLSKVKKIRAILNDNGIALNANFSDTYFKRHVFGARARKVAEKGADIMYELVKDGVNGGSGSFLSKRKKELQDLADDMVKLSGYDDAKIKKIDQIEKNMEEIDMSKQMSNDPIDLNEILDYVKETKKALQVLSDPKFGLCRSLPEEILSRVPDVLAKLEELEKSLSDGNIIDLSSKQALEKAKLIFKKVYAVRVNIDNTTISVGTVNLLDAALDAAEEWKAYDLAPKRKDRIDKDDVTLHEYTQYDTDIAALAEGEETLEKFAIFKALLDNKEKRRQVIKQNIDDIEKQIDEINAQIAEVGDKQREAFEQYQNDGDEVKLERAAERLEREEKRLQDKCARLDEKKDKLYAKMDSDDETEYMIRKSIYDPVVEFDDAYSLFVTAAAQIPYDTVNGIFFRGISGEEELVVFRKAILTLSYQHEDVVRSKKAAIDSQGDIEVLVKRSRAQAMSDDDKLREKMRELDRDNAPAQVEQPKKQSAADRLKSRYAQPEKPKEKVEVGIPPERLRISNDDK